MTKLLLLTLCCLTVSFVKIADAETLYQSGNAFVRQCAVLDKHEDEITPADTMYIMVCSAYVAGIVNGVEAEQVFANASLDVNVGTPYCLPVDRIESAQGVRIVLKYIHNNPAEAHKPAGLLVIKALHDAFPCSQPKK